MMVHLNIFVQAQKSNNEPATSLQQVHHAQPQRSQNARGGLSQIVIPALRTLDAEVLGVYRHKMAATVTASVARSEERFHAGVRQIVQFTRRNVRASVRACAIRRNNIRLLAMPHAVKLVRSRGRFRRRDIPSE
jgi:hypothetical protein